MVQCLAKGGQDKQGVVEGLVIASILQQLGQSLLALLAKSSEYLQEDVRPFISLP